jgi:hypothetical protein
MVEDNQSSAKVLLDGRVSETGFGNGGPGVNTVGLFFTCANPGDRGH